MRFGTVGSPKSTPLKPGGSIGAIGRIAELGLDALELGWVQSVRVSEETCAAIKQTAEQFKVAISVHAPYFINLNANEIEWPKSRKRLWDAAYFGYLAGATDIIFHPGSYFSLPAEEVLKNAIPRLQDLATELAQNGINVNLRPETMGKQAMLGSLADTLVMSKAINRVLPCIDFAHLYARSGDGTINDQNSWEKLLNEYREALGSGSLDRLHIHLSGIEFGPKGEKNHLAAKESGLDIPALFKALKKFNCEGRIMCESPILEDDALYFKELWNHSDLVY
jgi:deoxyribonuclease-4